MRVSYAEVRTDIEEQRNPCEGGSERRPLSKWTSPVARAAERCSYSYGSEEVTVVFEPNFGWQSSSGRLP
ncbi:MAG TPA: hypothetical protein EYO31_02800 [Phycisphaerales bacterium]|nr:hypothetical protein [Phycisphaerales bacterium]